MEIISLYYFSEAAKDLHITETANRQHITQQTLSNHILRLERHCKEENLPVVQFLKDCMGFYMNFYTRSSNLMEACPMHDGLAMVLAVRPDFAVYRKWIARVDCSQGLCRGQIVADRRLKPSLEGNFVEFAMQVAGEQAVDEMLAVLL